MQVYWRNIVVFVLLIVAVTLFLVYRVEIISFLMSMKDIGPTHSREDQTVGLIAAGLVMVCIVAITRILVSASERKDR